MKRAVIFTVRVLALMLSVLMVLGTAVTVLGANVATVDGTTYTDVSEAVDAAIAQDKTVTLTGNANVYLEPYETVRIDKGEYALTVSTKAGWNTVVLENTDGTVTAASYKDLGEKFASMNLLLDGSIAMKFYITNADVLENNADAYIEVKIPDRNGNAQVSKYYAEDLEVDARGRYVLEVKNIAAAQQTEKISFQVVNGEERGRLRQYSVSDYSNIVLKSPDSYSKKTVALVKSMANYGAMAQTIHTTNTNALANEGLYESNPVDGITAAMVEEAGGVWEPTIGGRSGVNEEACTTDVNLTSEVMLRIFFAADENEEFDVYDLVITAGDETLENVSLKPVESDGVFYGMEYTVRNISAQDYDKVYTIHFNTRASGNTGSNYQVEWKVNVLGHIKATLESEKTTAEQKSVAAAMFNYYVSMKNYLGQSVYTEADGHTCETHVEITKAATCTIAGEKSTKCTLCGKVSSTSVISASGHNKVDRAEVAATCTTYGIKAHIECTRCGELFDVETGEATTLDALKIAATGHDESVDGVWDAKLGRYMSASACDSCGEKYPVMGNINMTPAAMVANKEQNNNATVTASDDNAFVTYASTATDCYFYPYSYQSGGKTAVSGQYLIIKYRAATTAAADSQIVLYTSTTNDTAKNNGDRVPLNYEKDGEWHYLIVNLNDKIGDTIFGKEGGVYSANYLRFGTSETIDLAYMVMADNLSSLISSVKTFDVDARELVEETIGGECTHPDYAKSYKLLDGYTHVEMCGLCGYVADNAATSKHDVSGNLGTWDADKGYVASSTACTLCNGAYAADYVYVLSADDIASNSGASRPDVHSITSNGSYATIKSLKYLPAYNWLDLNPNNWSNNKHYVDKIVIKYRAPIAAAGDNIGVVFGYDANHTSAHQIELKADGVWHYAVIDMSEYPSFKVTDGVYTIGRFGIITSNINGTGKGLSTNSIDIEYIAFTAGDQHVQNVIEAKSETCTHTHVIGNVCAGCGEVRRTNTVQATVDKANELAGGIQTYFTNGFRNEVVLQNQSMALDYPLSATSDQLPKYIKSASGGTYISNTFDVFVKMTNGTKVYASDSYKNATMNSFRFGYYYYETRIEGQSFSSDVTGSSYKVTSNGKITTHNGSHSMNVQSEGNAMLATVTNISDPYVTLANTAIKYDSTAKNFNYQFIKFSIACAPADNQARSATIYAMTSKDNSYNTFTFDLVTDGSVHEYIICLADNWRLMGAATDINYLRFDVEGQAVGDCYKISEIEFVNGNGNGAPDLYLARNFHIYSDKLHHEVQITTDKEVSGIAEIGVEIKIPKTTVAKLVAVDAGGQKTSIGSVDWATAEFVAFDINNVGVFGYILPAGEIGTLKVTDDGTNYVITQIHTPGTIKAADGGVNEKNEVIRSDKVLVGNKNDFYMGQRIYTDESHSFDAFLKEAVIERNPLDASAFNLNMELSDNSKYLGYDPLRGSYEFLMKGSGFNEAFYYYPNRQIKLNFSVTGTDNRTIYLLASTMSGGLESSAVLDGNLMLLPIPVEVAKNFGTDGDNTKFDRLDTQYGEAIFPIVVQSGKTAEFNVLHLYQNWGLNPLKQGSSIEYKAPYYHLSTGTTETNCIVPFGWTTDWAISNMLPDHRTMSQAFWPDQPQHAASGIHAFLEYTDSEGRGRETAIKSQYLDAYGPTYFDVEMNYITTDNKVQVTFTNMEMPQTDENRAYYTMTFKFLDTVTVPNFANNFQFYSVTDRPGNGYFYTKLGYLNSSNQPATKTYATIDTANEIIPLGTNYPYFDMYQLNTLPDSKDGTGNVSFLIGDYEMVINGQKNPYGFAIKKDKDAVRLTLNTTNTVTFKAGDYVTFEAIIMPWGSQESDFSLGDQNVRDVRQNTFVNRVKISSVGADTVKLTNDTFLPEVMTTNGKTAEFTISGGGLGANANKTLVSTTEFPAKQNMVVRVYGFDTLTVPKIYEKVNGEWVEYEISSVNNPDKLGYGEEYDGYSMFKDADGTYSYAFVVDMSAGKARTFKVESDLGFEKWNRHEVADEYDFNLLNLYFDSVDIAAKIRGGVASGSYAGIEHLSENGMYYTRIKPSATASDPYTVFFDRGDRITGQYLVIKYRSNAEKNTPSILTSTVREFTYSGADQKSFGNVVWQTDGQWHVAVIDLSAILPFRDVNGGLDGDYIMKCLRFDFFNTLGLDPNTDYVDIAYIGVTEDLNTAVTLDNSTGEVLVLASDSTDASRGAICFYDPNTGAEKENTKIPFYSVHVDYVNDVYFNTRSNFDYCKDHTAQIDPYTYKAGIRGWIATKLGVAKYVAAIEDENGNVEWIELGAGTQASTGVQAEINKYWSNASVLGSYENANFNLNIELDPTKYHGQTVKLTVYAVTYSKNNADNTQDVIGGYIPIFAFTDVIPDHFGMIGTDNGNGTHTIKCVCCGANIITEDHNITGYASWNESKQTYVEECTICRAQVGDEVAANLFITPEMLYDVRNGGAKIPATLASDKSYVTFTAGNAWEWGKGYAMVSGFTTGLNPNGLSTGKFLIVKMRASEGSSADANIKLSFTTTAGGDINANDANLALTAAAGAGWVTHVINIEELLVGSKYPADTNGNYVIVGDRLYVLANTSVDIAYIGIAETTKAFASLGADCNHVGGFTSAISTTATTHTFNCSSCGFEVTQSHTDSSYGTWNGSFYACTCTVCGELTGTDYGCTVGGPAKDISVAESGWLTGGQAVDNYYKLTGGSDTTWRATRFYINPNGVATGQYVVFKYRVPTTSLSGTRALEFPVATGSNANENTSVTLTCDGNWHIAIVDFSKSSSYTMTDGKYYASNECRILLKGIPEIHFEYFYMYDDITRIPSSIWTSESGVTCDHSIGFGEKVNNTTHTSSCAVCAKSLATAEHSFTMYSNVSGTTYSQYCDACKSTIQVPGNIFITGNMLTASVTGGSKTYSGADYATYKTSSTDCYLTAYANATIGETGQWFVMKYRTKGVNLIQPFTSTVHTSTSGGYHNPSQNTVTDGEWHYIVIDLSAANNANFPTATTYSAKYLRIDLGSIADVEIDIAYVALANSLDGLVSGINSYESKNLCAGISGSYLTAHKPSSDVTWNESVGSYYATCSVCNKAVAVAGNVVVTPYDMMNNVTVKSGYSNSWARWSGTVTRTLATNGAYFTLTSTGSDSWASIYGLNNTAYTGKYAIIKYRAGAQLTNTKITVYTSTVNGHCAGGDNAAWAITNTDTEWHYLVIDLSRHATVTGDAIQYFRIGGFDAVGDSIDFAYLVFGDDIDHLKASVAKFDEDFDVNTGFASKQ